MSCPVLMGKGAYLANGTTKLAKITSLDFSKDKNLQSITSFGDLWDKFCGGLQSFTSNAGGFIDPNDAEQVAFIRNGMEGTDMPNLRLHWDSTTYIAIDLVTDAEGTFHISNLSSSMEPAGPITFTTALTASGPVKLYPEP